MEMPIQVIIVLFLALVVGGAILAFSQSSLNNAQQTLNDQWKNDPANKDQVVEVATATDATILNLAKECVKRNAGSVEEQLCFALFATQYQVNWNLINNAELGQGFNLSVQMQNPNANALRITYDPFTNHVDVT
jgi:hypothetical protein